MVYFYSTREERKYSQRFFLSAGFAWLSGTKRSQWNGDSRKLFMSNRKRLGTDLNLQSRPETAKSFGCHSPNSHMSTLAELLLSEKLLSKTLAFHDQLNGMELHFSSVPSAAAPRESRAKTTVYVEHRSTSSCLSGSRSLVNSAAEFSNRSVTQIGEDKSNNS